MLGGSSLLSTLAADEKGAVAKPAEGLVPSVGLFREHVGNADYLLRFIVDAVKSAVAVTSVVTLRKASVSLPAPGDMLDRLAGEADVVVSAMAD